MGLYKIYYLFIKT